MTCLAFFSYTFFSPIVRSSRPDELEEPALREIRLACPLPVFTPRRTPVPGALCQPMRCSTRLIPPPPACAAVQPPGDGLFVVFFSLAASGGALRQQWQNDIYPGSRDGVLCASVPGLIRPQLIRAPCMQCTTRCTHCAPLQVFTALAKARVRKDMDPEVLKSSQVNYKRFRRMAFFTRICSSPHEFLFGAEHPLALAVRAIPGGLRARPSPLRYEFGCPPSRSRPSVPHGSDLLGQSKPRDRGLS